MSHVPAHVTLPPRWFLLDARIGGVSDRAYRLYHTLLALAVHNGTDGRVTHSLVKMVWRYDLYDESHYEELVNETLLVRDDAGYQIVDYRQHQSSKTDRGVIERARAADRDRKSRQRGKVNDAVFERDGHRCLHCGTGENLTVDHIYPQSLGGGRTLDNLQTLCRSCNSRKGTRVETVVPPGLEWGEQDAG